MTRALVLTVLLINFANSFASAEGLTRERYNWMLNCQGCHGAKGQATAIDTPVLYKQVGRFLNVEGGRKYLVSVPGVVNAPINDAEKADLFTWIINVLDPEHKPADFKPFTEEEMTWGRNNPLLIGAQKRRKELLKLMDEIE